MNNSLKKTKSENNANSLESLTNQITEVLPVTRRMKKIKEMLESKRSIHTNVQKMDDTVLSSNSESQEENRISSNQTDKEALVKRIPGLKLGNEVENAHNGRIECVLFLQDKQLICTGSVDKTIKIWNSSTLELITTLNGHKNWICRLIRLNKDQIASCSNDFTIKVWNLSTMRLSQTLKGHSRFVLRITLLSNDFLLSSSLDQKIMIWKRDGSTKYQQHNTYTSPRQLDCYTIFEISSSSESSTKIIAAGSEKRINLYAGKETNSGFQLTMDSAFWGQHYIVTDIQAIGHNNQYLLSCCMQTLRLWSLQHKRCFKTLRHSHLITSILPMTSEIFITPCQDILVWTIYSGKFYKITKRKGSDPIQTMVKLNGDKLIVAGQGKKLEIWDY
jgi:WD40 repeat protein